MAAGEFQLIARHLSRLGADRPDVVLGPGDDAALLDPGGRALAVAHGHSDAAGEPRAAAVACLREALAGLAEAGATPAWATLALSLAPGDYVLRGETDLGAFEELLRVDAQGGRFVVDLARD